MGQGQNLDFVQRAKDAAERLEADFKPATPEKASVAPASVPDVAGKDVAVATTLVPPTAPEASTEAAPAPVEATPAAPSDVQLLRDQLSEVVTNFRARLDSHDAVLSSVESAAKAIAERVATVEGFVEEHKTALDALLTAIEAIAK